MKRIIVTILFFIIGAGRLLGQDNRAVLTLDAVIAKAKSQSIAAKIAQSEKENKYYQFLTYKAGLRPQLALDGNLPNYSKDVFGVVQPDGSLIFQRRSQNNSALGLSLSQQIAATGGTLAINSNLNRFDDFDRSVKQYSGIPVSISLIQPLFAFNKNKWDKKIEPMKYEEAEKEYTKEGEDIASQTVKLYFNVLDAQADLELAKKNLESGRVIFDIENKRIELGTTTKDKILQIKLQLLKSTQDLSNSEVNLKTSLFNLKSFIGLNDLNIIGLTVPDILPPVNISVEKAISSARKNRAEFVGYLRRKLEAERDLDLAKKERFAVNLAATYGYSNIGNTLTSVYVRPNSQQTISIDLQLPILDWGRNKGKISVANSNLRTVTYTIEQEEIIFVQEITNLVENLKLIATNITIARQADEIAQERYELNNEQFRFGKITVTDLNISLSEKDLAKRAYVTALRTFWESYYQLRVLTLANLNG